MMYRTMRSRRSYTTHRIVETGGGNALLGLLELRQLRTCTQRAWQTWLARLQRTRVRSVWHIIIAG